MGVPGEIRNRNGLVLQDIAVTIEQQPPQLDSGGSTGDSQVVETTPPPPPPPVIEKVILPVRGNSGHSLNLRKEGV